MLGQDQSPVAVVPANEGLDAGDLEGPAADLGLIEELQLVVADGVAQVVLEGNGVDAHPLLRGVEILDAVAAAPLGHGQCLFGVPGELVVVATVVGKHGQADAGRDEQFPALDVQGQRQAALQFLQCLFVSRFTGAAGQQGHEAVGTGAGQPRAGGDGGTAPFGAGMVADHGIQPLADGLQEGITHAMPEAVVELAEAVEVQQHHGVGGGAGAQHHFQPAHEAAAVGQTRQQVLLEQPVTIDLEAQALAQLQVQGGFVEGLAQDVGQVQCQGFRPERVARARREHDDRQPLPGRRADGTTHPLQSLVIRTVYRQEQQRKCGLTVDEFVGLFQTVGHTQGAQMLGVQHALNRVPGGGVGVEQQDGVLLLDQGVFAAVCGVAPDTDVCL